MSKDITLDLEQEICNEIPLMDFGKKIVIRGILFANDETDDSWIAVLPQKDKPKAIPLLIQPTLQEWHDIFEQQDVMFVRGTFNGEHIIKRKSQRNVDGVISWKVFRRDKYECRYCGINHVPLTVDHIITWETGGATHVDNLLTSCKKCNRTRGNTPYDEFLKSDYYKGKMEYLRNGVIQLNEAIVAELSNLPRVAKVRKR